MSTEFDDSSVDNVPVTEAEVASTGAAADSVESDERLRSLPRLLRYVILSMREERVVQGRLVAEIAEACPGLAFNLAWAVSFQATAGVALAGELDRLAVADDRSDLRSLADCVRLLSLTVPSKDEHLADHRRTAKALLQAQRNLPDDLDGELASNIEAVAWGWAALPFARDRLTPYGSERALSHAISLGRIMARKRLDHAEKGWLEQRIKTEQRPGNPGNEAAGASVDMNAVPENHVVVCRLDEATVKNPKTRELIAPFKHAINVALPLIPTPTLPEVRTKLLFEFPYAQTVIDFALTDLVGRSTVRLRPLLLVGEPGGGKSRFARRLGEVLNLGVWRTDASRSDGAVFAGTDKRWHSAEPCHPFMAIARAGHANPLVLIDELEKAGTRSDWGRFWDALLGFLEQNETASRYPDPALQTECDLSHLSYIATANSVDALPGPLRDRFRMIEFPKPRASDLDALLPALIVDLAGERGLDARWIAPLDGDERATVLRFWNGGSVRRLRRVIEAILNARDAAMAIKH